MPSIQNLKYGIARASRPLANKNREAVLPFSSSLINPAYQLGRKYVQNEVDIER